MIPSVDLLFIGAPKCGTTWLTRRLAQHPELAMPDDEVHYYSRYHARGPGWYRGQFPDPSDRKLGENSNSYLTEPGALPLIAKEQPQARILCILRDPIARAYSSYGMQIDRGRATGDIDLYLDPDRSPRPHILSNGLYARMLAPWFEQFPRERILVERFDAIRSEPEHLLRRVFEFLGIDPEFESDSLTEHDNARKKEGVPGSVKRALWWARPILTSPVMRPIVSGPVGNAAKRILTQPKHYPPLSTELRARLADYYEADLARLEALTGQSFSDWRVG